MVNCVRAVLLALCLYAVWIIFYTFTTNKLAGLRAALDLDNPVVVTAREREQQLECLAINIYREAGYEPFEGKVGVAQVTMNRVKDRQFPNDVCAVVYQKSAGTRIVCQFSWYCDSKHRNRPVGQGYEESYIVAQKVLLEGFGLPSLEHALFYHADYVNPRWRLDRIGKFGVHIFYKQRKKHND